MLSDWWSHIVVPLCMAKYLKDVFHWCSLFFFQGRDVYDFQLPCLPKGTCIRWFWTWGNTEIHMREWNLWCVHVHGLTHNHTLSENDLRNLCMFKPNLRPPAKVLFVFNFSWLAFLNSWRFPLRHGGTAKSSSRHWNRDLVIPHDSRNTLFSCVIWPDVLRIKKKP